MLAESALLPGSMHFFWQKVHRALGSWQKVWDLLPAERQFWQKAIKPGRSCCNNLPHQLSIVWARPLSDQVLLAFKCNHRDDGKLGRTPSNLEVIAFKTSRYLL